MGGSIIVPPELPLLSSKVVIQAFQLAVYHQVGRLAHEFDSNTAGYISFIYSHYPPPDFSGPLYTLLPLYHYRLRTFLLQVTEAQNSTFHESAIPPIGQWIEVPCAALSEPF